MQEEDIERANFEELSDSTCHPCAFPHPSVRNMAHLTQSQPDLTLGFQV